MPETAAVVLMSMGEPEAPADVGPYLRELMLDPALVRLPALAPRRLLAWGAGRFGGRRLRRALSRIGGSPLARLSAAQARALEASLRAAGSWRVYAAMRYGRPSIAEAARRARQDGAVRIVGLPLFPQFCGATGGSALKALRAEAGALPVAEIKSWPDQPGFIAALCELVARSLARASGREARLLFCAHGVPRAFIEAGDPYESEVKRTVAAVARVFPETPWSLAYQGSGGRRRWLEPEAGAELVRLARGGAEA
ncbi:MAG: ferrochelatase, partial [Elusimicrobia bacterium]|nr:ferrochelatase [Elusimicrobiota bacterium]